MEVSGGSEEGFVREWTPCSHVLNLIPPRIQTGLFSSELCLTCVDAVSEYIALGTNVGLVYWYDRKKGNIQRLRCEASNSPITFVKIVSTVDYMVGAGNDVGQVTVFQIPKEHPDNIPDNFKPKVEPKVERYTIGELHKSQITAIEWSKNGMRLFSGDKNGVIIMTEIDFYMHLCKSMEIVNEGHEIVQMSYHQNTLLVSSLYRSILCERRDGKWLVNQLGKRERKSLCALGAVFQYSYAAGGAPRVYCARPGLRLWRADTAGDVLQTLLFKEAISNPLTVAELLNPAATKHCHSSREYNLGPLHVFREHFLVSHNEHFLYILDPRSLQAVAALDQLRRILSVCVNKDEIFILEGPRSLVRLAHAPEPAALAPEEPHLMSKSLSTLQHAATAVRDHTAPYIARVLEQPIAIFTQNELIDHTTVTDAEECFELPPIKQLPTNNMPGNVLKSIVNEFKDTTNDDNEKSEEIKKKLKLYNSIMEKKYDEELIHSRSRSRRREGGSGDSTPRIATPVRKVEGVVNTACVMNVSVFGNLPQQNDELLEKQIEEKEKILAKMLNLDSLSIPTADTTPKHTYDTPTHTYKHIEIQEKIDSPEKTYTQTQFNTAKQTDTQEKTNRQDTKTVKLAAKLKESNPIDLIPKVVKLPNTWNLNDMELKLDLKVNGYKDNRVISPDDTLESEWEFV